MRFILCFCILLISFSSFAQTNAPTTNAINKNAYSGSAFWYYSKKDRITAILDLSRSIDLDYGLLPFKQKAMGLDFKKLNEDGFAQEKNINEITISAQELKDPAQLRQKSFLQAKANLDFLDRARYYVASFQDTHFSISAKIPTPSVYDGLKLTRVGGKLLVSGKNSKLLSYVSAASGVASIK
ncbi:MAG: hypothetical protein WCG27_11225, partial [Pseudomonadota bacterium]